MLIVHHVACHQPHCLEHTLCWNGLQWLSLEYSQWPKPAVFSDPLPEDAEISLVVKVETTEPIVLSEQYSQYTHLIRIIAWVLRFISHCKKKGIQVSPYLTTHSCPMLSLTKLQLTSYRILLKSCILSGATNTCPDKAISGRSSLISINLVSYDLKGEVSIQNSVMTRNTQ